MIGNNNSDLKHETHFSLDAQNIDINMNKIRHYLKDYHEELSNNNNLITIELLLKKFHNFVTNDGKKLINTSNLYKNKPTLEEYEKLKSKKHELFILFKTNFYYILNEFVSPDKIVYNDDFVYPGYVISLILSNNPQIKSFRPRQNISYDSREHSIYDKKIIISEVICNGLKLNNRQIILPIVKVRFSPEFIEKSTNKTEIKNEESDEILSIKGYYEDIINLYKEALETLENKHSELLKKNKCNDPIINDEKECLRNKYKNLTCKLTEDLIDQILDEYTEIDDDKLKKYLVSYYILNIEDNFKLDSSEKTLFTFPKHKNEFVKRLQSNLCDDFKKEIRKRYQSFKFEFRKICGLPF